MITHDAASPVAIIADDEDIGRLLLAEAVSAAGLRPVAVGDGLAALQAAAGHEVAIVLLDVNMPGLDGFSVCRRLRGEERFKTVPIVMVTGHEDSAAVEHAFEAGATDFIAKPVNWALLPHRLEYILRNASQVRALAARETQVRTLVEALPDRLWVVAPGGEVRWSPRGTKGDDRDGSATTVHDSSAGLAPVEHLARTLTAIRDTARDGAQRSFEYRDPSSSDPHRSYELRFTRREGGDVVVVRQDTSARTAAAAHIEQLAYFDPLTGLPNRQRCIETAQGFLAQAQWPQESVAFIYMDLNGFKRINDTFGHPIGDAVLRTVAGKLREVLQGFRNEHPNMILARFGGDEFVIVLRDVEARAIASEIAEACCVALKDSIPCEGLEFHASPSVGISVYPEDGEDVATVLKHADTAMYQAKTAVVPSIAVYTPAMSSRLRDWLDLEARLRRALNSNGLSLHFQPKFRLADDRVVGVEALLRWYDPELGEIPPSRFVHIAEESGLIIELGGWVARAACRQVRAWLDRGITMPVAVNVSPRELLHGDPARVIETEARAAGVAASLLEIEITESLLVRDSVAVRRALERFRHLGCQIALDDFGTGFSSLAYITRLPPDRIKIDKAFVNNVDRSASDAAVANAILSLGESLGLKVTAEGIERTGQLEWLRRRGCHEVQGFLLSHPLSSSELELKLLRPGRLEPMAAAAS
jgi:diguanylate cyclase (GGDEF)-like protein